MFIRDCQGVFRVLKKNRAGSKARERQKAPSKSHGGKVLSGELTLRWGPGQTMGLGTWPHGEHGRSKVPPWERACFAE